MTYAEIRKVVYEEAQRMEKIKTGIATDEAYRYGKIAGMLKAFRTAEILTEADSCKLHNEIMNEFF